MVKLYAYLDGTLTDEITNLQEIEVDLSFLSDSRTSETVQPVISINSLNIVGQSALKIINYQTGGVDGTTPGILEGMPLEIVATDGTITVSIFSGFLNFKEYKQISLAEVSVGITETGSMNSFNSISKGTYFNLLETKNVFKQSHFVNVPFIVEVVDKGAVVASLSVTIFVLAMALKAQTEKVAKELATFAGIFGAGVTGSFASGVYLGLVLLFDTYTLILLVDDIIELGKQMARTLAPPVQNHKAIFEKTLFDVTFAHLGYSFETNITEMSNTVFLNSSKARGETIKSGVPKVGQVGANLSGMIEMMLNKYHARFVIIDKVAHIRSVNDTFWKKQATFQLEDVGSENITDINLESEIKQFNNVDFKANTHISYNNDIADAYTLENYKGRDFLVIREPNWTKGSDKLLFDGLDEIAIPTALATRKDTLDEIEEFLSDVLYWCDVFADVINFFKPWPTQPSNLQGLITNRIGAMKISQSVYNVPKSVYLVDGKIPVNHREMLSAKALYIKYHSEKSFVNTKPKMFLLQNTDSSVIYADSNKPDFGGQKRVFTDVFIPNFGVENYISIKNNSYFWDKLGQSGKIESSKWIPSEGKAVASYWIKEVWTENIQEKFIEVR